MLRSTGEFWNSATKCQDMLEPVGSNCIQEGQATQPPKEADTEIMRVLFLTRYGRLGASSRQRCFIYLDALRAAGITADVRPFLADQYVRKLHAGRPASLPFIFRSYAARLLVLLKSRGYDLLWIEKEALPWVPAWVECALLRMIGAKIIVDYDDAIFHAYDRHRNSVVRKLLASKIDRIMAKADLVTVGSSYLGLRAKAAGARAVAELPTVVDLKHYPDSPSAPPDTERPFTLGWIGSPLTSTYLEPLRPALTELTAQLPLKIILIGAAAGSLIGLPIERVAWSADTEAAELARCDAGIMPLPDLPWERGKCGYKLIQYMASALPVVASPVGINREIVTHGETGFLAETTADWISSLFRLACEPELRRRMGIAGRCRAEANYSLDAVAPKLIELMYGVRAAQSGRQRASAADRDLTSSAATRQRPI
jgi:glycosyltransferase involved in cell wall biosynthesis